MLCKSTSTSSVVGAHPVDHNRATPEYQLAKKQWHGLGLRLPLSKSQRERSFNRHFSCRVDGTLSRTDFNSKDLVPLSSSFNIYPLQRVITPIILLLKLSSLRLWQISHSSSCCINDLSPKDPLECAPPHCLNIIITHRNKERRNSMLYSWATLSVFIVPWWNVFSSEPLIQIANSVEKWTNFNGNKLQDSLNFNDFKWLTMAWIRKKLFKLAFARILIISGFDLPGVCTELFLFGENILWHILTIKKLNKVSQYKSINWNAT